jgi:hypothetical protein
MTDRQTAHGYRLEAEGPDGKTVSVNLGELIDEMTAAKERGEGQGANFPMGDTPEGKRALAAQEAYDLASIANPQAPVDPAIRAELEAAHDALAKLLAANHVDDNRKRDDSYDRDLLAKGYSWEQIARTYRLRAESYRLDLVTYATRARNMENEIRATLAPLQMSTKLYREIMRQLLQATMVLDTDRGLAALMFDEIQRKLHAVGEDESFRLDVKRYVEAKCGDASLLDAIDMPLTSEQRIGDYHGQ